MCVAVQAQLDMVQASSRANVRLATLWQSRLGLQPSFLLLTPYWKLNGTSRLQIPAETLQATAAVIAMTFTKNASLNPNTGVSFLCGRKTPPSLRKMVNSFVFSATPHY